MRMTPFHIFIISGLSLLFLLLHIPRSAYTVQYYNYRHTEMVPKFSWCNFGIKSGTVVLENVQNCVGIKLIK